MPLSCEGVASQYTGISQLQLEMYCIGPDCRSAVIVRQSATRGALILRMRRSYEWIKEMFYWLNKFQRNYVDRSQPPPPNFFLRNDKGRYLRFLNHTLKIQRSHVDVVAHIEHGDIQRHGESSFFLD
jgi:hypothetical protein